MIEWQYQTISIKYERKKHKDWVAQTRGDAPLVGMNGILSAYGAQGWELVALAPEQIETVAGFGKWQTMPVTYRATFKRAREV